LARFHSIFAFSELPRIQLVMPSGWELEVESLLMQLARRDRPVIPVILKSRKGIPRLPAFLRTWQVVDMRQPVPDPFEQLVWGITGEKGLRGGE